MVASQAATETLSAGDVAAANGNPEPTPRDPWNSATASDVFGAPLPEPRWAVPGLEIGPGRPCGLWSKPGVGKTLIAQELGVCTAAGIEAFGRYPCERGRVLHISYDVGTWAVWTRYRQLGNGHGLSREDIGNRLSVDVFPDVYLNSPNAEQWFDEHCRGFDLVLLDCFRDAVPGVDENDSTVAVFLKILARISERHGCSFLYLHHVKKGDGATTIDSGRGSGAIGAASGTIWSLEGNGSRPRVLRHVRLHDASRGFQDPVRIRLRTEPAGGAFEVNGRPKWIVEMVGSKERPEQTQQAQEDADALVVLLSEFPEGLTETGLRDALRATGHRWGRDRLAVAREVLGDRLVKDGSGQRRCIRLAEAVQ